MKYKVFIFGLMILLPLTFNSCDPGSERLVGLDPDRLPAKGIKDGEQKIYNEKGVLTAIVEVKNGKANGRVRKYYDDGHIRMDAIYRNGKKEGKCTYYYGNNIPYTVSNYVNGYKEGEERIYYEGGELMAITSYQKNEVLPGLREFKKDGTPIKDDIAMVLKEIDHSLLEGKVIIRVSLTDQNLRPKYYMWEKDNPESRIILNNSGNTGVWEISVSAGSFEMKKLVFEAQFKTSRGNLRVIRKNYNFSADL